MIMGREPRGVSGWAVPTNPGPERFRSAAWVLPRNRT